VTRKDRSLVAARIHERFDLQRQRRILLGLEPVITTQQKYSSVEEEI